MACRSLLGRMFFFLMPNSFLMLLLLVSAVPVALFSLSFLCADLWQSAIVVATLPCGSESFLSRINYFGVQRLALRFLIAFARRDYTDSAVFVAYKVLLLLRLTTGFCRFHLLFVRKANYCMNPHQLKSAHKHTYILTYYIFIVYSLFVMWRGTRRRREAFYKNLLCLRFVIVVV